MFDITTNDIFLLNDVDLRELVGRLCEAEVSSLGLSPAAVTWGGSQTAADGGLDVRVALPAGGSISGFIPKLSTGFQVKTPDMPRKAILKEMRPAGIIRPAIRELASEGGCYVIVSSGGSTTDSVLQKRQAALREAIEGMEDGDRLQTEFYDRTRLASWVRCHPGLVAWVKAKVGRSHTGWRPYGNWSNISGGVEDEYILDDRLRLHLGESHEASPKPISDGIDKLRDVLIKPGKIIRLVGLSGVGKTRFVQALFDRRIGSYPLPASLAVYADLSDNPDPQPMSLASDLIANRRRAVLIVDNCPPELHRRLSSLCAEAGSSVSLLTIEYDVRDDQPEGTQVVSLDTSSAELIELLLARRFPSLSKVDARTIAEVCAGNARIAIAIATTVNQSETISGLSDDDLFQRLFRQRHDADTSLLRAAQVISLVYSFQGEIFEGEDAELPRLAALAGQASGELYSYVSELLRRDLVQKRGVWRAVLPHAIANKLAARALDDIPYSFIDRYIVTGGTSRLAQSFSRRLSFLHFSPRVIEIVERWLMPDGLLGDIASFKPLHRAMFENVAPVSPERALAVLERTNSRDSLSAARVFGDFRAILRSLAYAPHLFERAALLLAHAAKQGTEIERKEATGSFLSLFPLYLSGTHATIEQRLALIERLLQTGEPDSHSLALAALGCLLKTTSFSSHSGFAFGGRSRNFGYSPKSNAESEEWYRAALALIERIFFVEDLHKPELRDLIATHFRGLWVSAGVYYELERLCRRFACNSFWRDGWVACRSTLRLDRDRMAPEIKLRLESLEADLRPTSLSERVHAVVLSSSAGSRETIDIAIVGDRKDVYEELEAFAYQLGQAVAVDDRVFAELLPDLFQGGARIWEFGCGLASRSTDVFGTWKLLVNTLHQLPEKDLNIQILRAFLAEVWRQNKNTANTILDLALHDLALSKLFPLLHSALPLDERGVARLVRSVEMECAPIWMFRNLATGRATEFLDGNHLSKLLLVIAEKPEGHSAAIEILHMRFHADRSAKRQHEEILLEAGRELLSRIKFVRSERQDDYELAEIVNACLARSHTAPIVVALIKQLRLDIATHDTYALEHQNLLKALISVQPLAVLDTIFEQAEGEHSSFGNIFQDWSDHLDYPTDDIPCDVLTGWCDTDRNSRYSLAASIVTFARRSPEDGRNRWSPQARALIASAPDPKQVITVFASRFLPMSWSGSRAAIMGRNCSLLDDTSFPLPVDKSFLNRIKDELEQQVAQQRQWELAHDRVRDERFE